jgi:hypothetical protein
MDVAPVEDRGVDQDGGQVADLAWGPAADLVAGPDGDLAWDPRGGRPADETSTGPQPPPRNRVSGLSQAQRTSDATL